MATGLAGLVVSAPHGDQPDVGSGPNRAGDARPAASTSSRQLRKRSRTAGHERDTRNARNVPTMPGWLPAFPCGG
jgi:hypothetical protein